MGKILGADTPAALLMICGATTALHIYYCLVELVSEAQYMVKTAAAGIAVERL